MYVCICNGLTDRDFRSAAQNGATTVAKAFKALGEAPQCGRCFSCAREVIEATRAEMDDAAAAAAVAVAAE